MNELHLFWHYSWKKKILAGTGRFGCSEGLPPKKKNITQALSTATGCQDLSGSTAKYQEQFEGGGDDKKQEDLTHDKGESLLGLL